MCESANESASVELMVSPMVVTLGAGRFTLSPRKSTVMSEPNGDNGPTGQPVAVGNAW